MQERQRKHLWRLALSDATSSSALMLKVRAVNELCEAGISVPLDRVREELQIVLENDFGTFLAGRAASMAARLLSIMDGEHPDVFPDAEPHELAGAGYWHPDPGNWGDLDSFDDRATRDHWRRMLEGLPPWKR
jgi:hypothetical protein